MCSNYLQGPKIVLTTFSRWYHFTKSTNMLQRFFSLMLKTQNRKERKNEMNSTSRHNMTSHIMKMIYLPPTYTEAMFALYVPDT